MYDQEGLAGGRPDVLQRDKDVNVFATFGDQMAAGAVTALKLVGGYTPGKNIAIIGYGGAKEAVTRSRPGRGTPPSACTRPLSRRSASPP